MAYNDYILLDGKKYHVMAEGWQPVYDRFRYNTVGLTGLTIICDLTPANRAPQSWNYRLKVFVNDPEPDSTWGTFADFLTAYEKATVEFTEHDDSLTHTVTWNGQVIPEPRVPAAAITGQCNEFFYVPTSLVKVYE